MCKRLTFPLSTLWILSLWRRLLVKARKASTHPAMEMTEEAAPLCCASSGLLTMTPVCSRKARITQRAAPESPVIFVSALMSVCTHCHTRRDATPFMQTCPTGRYWLSGPADPSLLPRHPPPFPPFMAPTRNEPPCYGSPPLPLSSVLPLLLCLFHMYLWAVSVLTCVLAHTVHSEESPELIWKHASNPCLQCCLCFSSPSRLLLRYEIKGAMRRRPKWPIRTVTASLISLAWLANCALVCATHFSPYVAASLWLQACLQACTLKLVSCLGLDSLPVNESELTLMLDPTDAWLPESQQSGWDVSRSLTLPIYTSTLLCLSEGLPSHPTFVF